MTHQTSYVYLKTGKFYSNGQSLVPKEEALMPSTKAAYYLEGAAARGLEFHVEPATNPALTVALDDLDSQINELNIRLNAQYCKDGEDQDKELIAVLRRNQDILVTLAARLELGIDQPEALQSPSTVVETKITAPITPEHIATARRQAKQAQAREAKQALLTRMAAGLKSAPVVTPVPLTPSPTPVMQAPKVINLSNSSPIQPKVNRVELAPKYQRPAKKETTRRPTPQPKPVVKSYRVEPTPMEKVEVKSVRHAGAAYNYLQSNGILDRRDAFKLQYQMSGWW